MVTLRREAMKILQEERVNRAFGGVMRFLRAA